MAYCTNAELSEIIDTTIGTASLDKLIAQVDRRIKARIHRAGITPPASDDMLKGASLDLSKADILTYNRLKEDLTDRNMTKTVRFGETTISDDPDKLGDALTERAWGNVDAYIAVQTGAAAAKAAAVTADTAVAAAEAAAKEATANAEAAKAAVEEAKATTAAAAVRVPMPRSTTSQ